MNASTHPARFVWITVLMLLLGTTTLTAMVVHDEAVDGDLSGDAATPTAIAFVDGSNIVTGTMGAPDDVRDFLTFTLPPDRGLVALRLLDYTDVSTGAGGNRGYHALNLGGTSFVPGPDTADDFLGGAHLDPEPAGTDLLPLLASAPQNGTGFVVPLGPGVYSYIVQQTGTEITAYSVEFVVEPISPLPVPVDDPRALALLALLLAAGGLIALRRA